MSRTARPMRGPSAASWVAMLWPVALLAVTACAPVRTLSCVGGARDVASDTLYFGTATSEGAVTPEEWATFLQTFVTPRFPNGITVLPASGQWQDARGSLVRETTYVLLLVHRVDASNERAVQELITQYKSQFRQEAVLRVTTRACASY